MAKLQTALVCHRYHWQNSERTLYSPGAKGKSRDQIQDQKLCRSMKRDVGRIRIRTRSRTCSIISSSGPGHSNIYNADQIDKIRPGPGLKNPKIGTQACHNVSVESLRFLKMSKVRARRQFFKNADCVQRPFKKKILRLGVVQPIFCIRHCHMHDSTVFYQINFECICKQRIGR